MTTQALKTAILMATTAALSACGGSGGGSGVASISAPPPVPTPTPTPTSTPTFAVQNQLAPAPAWATGNYQGIALFRDLLTDNVAILPDGLVNLAVDKAAKTYTLTVGAGSVIIGPTVFGTQATPSSPYAPYIGTTVKVGDNFIDVTSTGFTRPDSKLAGDKILSSYLAVASDPGRHVSLGYWNLSEAPLNPDGSRGVTNAWSEGQFVFGDRTEPGDIPVGGTAKYEADNFFPLVFNVDFGTKSIAATFSRSLSLGLYPDGSVCCYGGEEYVPDPATLIGTVAISSELSGIAPFTLSGGFNIALSGSGLVHTDRIDHSPVADINKLLSGAISGAFFGPQAGELGGAYILPFLGPTGMVSDNPGTFTAVKIPGP